MNYTHESGPLRNDEATACVANPCSGPGHYDDGMGQLTVWFEDSATEQERRDFLEAHPEWGL